ncbi:MAG: heavy metal translocating P-type ATPase, partial [Pseudomonadota bacterium]
RIGPDGVREEVPVDALRLGDRIAVAPGGHIPADGRVTAGRSEIDTALLTGETVPRAAVEGAELNAGMMNLTGPLEIEVTGLGEDTLLKRIARLVEQAETARNRYTGLADKAAKIYAPGVHLLAAGAFLGWYLSTGDARLAVNIAAAVLIITCPCALGLAVPSVLASASGRLFARGILMKDGAALERLAEIDAVVFDKTGTLTTGAPRLAAPEALSPETLAAAAGLAEGSHHPLARAIAAHAVAAGVRPAPLTDIVEHPGFGTEGWRGETRLRLGRADWVGAVPGEATATWLQIGEAAPVEIPFTDAPREDAGEVVGTLARAGLPVTLLSGDVAGAVRRLARRLGIGAWQAGMTPVEKAEAVAAMDGRVLMVGDGLNDSAALAAAHVSMAPAAGVDVTRATADFILLGNRLTHVAEAWRLARAARARILENFGIAACYNAVAIPLALSGVATPLMAAVAMSTSSILVTANALRLRGGEPPGLGHMGQPVAE